MSHLRKCIRHILVNRFQHLHLIEECDIFYYYDCGRTMVDKARDH